MNRILVRAGLIVAILVALTVAITCGLKLGVSNPTTWATFAAVLAVLAAVVSAWTGQRVLELQEDVLESNPTPVIDLRRRYQIAQFRITNQGGSPAFDVCITWEQGLTDAEGQDVVLGSSHSVPVIPTGESASVFIGTANRFMEAHKDATFRGTIKFKNASGRERSKPFVVTAEHERSALVHDDEMLKALHELQKVPDALASIAAKIDELTPRSDYEGK